MTSFPHRWLTATRTRHDGTTTSHSPPPGCCQSLVCYQNRFLLLFGGGSPQRFANEVYVFDLDSRTWSCRQPENSDIVAPRMGHTAAIYRDSMIVYGGQHLHSPVIYDDVLSLDLVAWRWSLMQRAPAYPDGPGARHLHCAHVTRDTMYVLLGSPGQTDESPVWSLDLPSGVWHNVGPTATATRAHGGSAAEDDDDDVPPALYGCCSAACGDSLYVFGGYRIEGTQWLGDTPRFASYVQTLYEFNTRHCTWRLVRPARPLPVPPTRCAAAMAVHHGYVYVCSGDANHASGTCYFNDVYRLRLPTAHQLAGSWELVAVAGSGPCPRSGCAYVCARSSLYLVGGEVESPWPFTFYSDETFALPLGYSGRLSLRESVARWMGLPTLPTSLCRTAWAHVPLTIGARQALELYTTS